MHFEESVHSSCTPSHPPGRMSHAPLCSYSTLCNSFSRGSFSWLLLFFCFCVFCQFQRCLLQRSLHSIVRVSAPSEERELCTVVQTRFRPLKISLNDSLGARMRPPVDVCLEFAGGRSRRVLRAGLGLGSGFNPNSLSLV